MFWHLQGHHILIYSYIYSFYFNSNDVNILNILLLDLCVSLVNCLLYTYGLYGFLVTCFISNCKYRHWIYEVCLCVLSARLYTKEYKSSKFCQRCECLELK